MTFAKVWKTYACAAVAAGLGIYQGLIQYGMHLPPVPSFVIWILGAAGLYSARSAITTDTQKATTDILSQITTPVPTPPSVVAQNAIVSAGKTMTAKANGTAYSSFISAGWTDAELIQQGYMLDPKSA